MIRKAAARSIRFCNASPILNPKDVWDSNYVGVWHLGESALPLKESSKRTRDFSAAIGTGFGYAASGSGA